MKNASAWHNGKPNLNTGAGYGLRIDSSYAPNVFRSRWKTVELRLRGQTKPVRVNISLSAKLGRCRELRHREIGLWLLLNKNHQWPLYQPPRFTVQYVNANVFSVT